MGANRRQRIRRLVYGALAALHLGGPAGAVAASPAAAGAWAEPLAADRWEKTLGPLIQTFPLTLEPGWGTEAAGPFYYRQERDGETLLGLPPFYSDLQSADGDREVVRVLPPIFSYHKYGRDMRWEVGQWLNGSRVDTIEDKELKRFNVFPFFFYQDAPDPNRRFWGLLPVYGTIRNRLGLDQIRFAAFPLWAETRKGGSRTENILFPFGHLRTGPGLDGWKIWPLAGQEHLAPTTRTNLSDQIEVVPGHDTLFALWPIYYRDRLGLGTDNPQRIDATLPLYYVQRSPQRDHTAVVWPFVSWSDDRAEKYHQVNAPWPFVSFARGPGKTLDRVLPLFNVGHTPTMDIESYLWPMYRRQHLHTPNMNRDRRQYGFYVFIDLREGNPETGQRSRRLDSWPFFAWSRDREGNERLRVPALAEAFGSSPGIESNWAPLWSLWRQERNAKTGVSSQSLLWNLYRREAMPDRTRGSLLFGLVQYEKTPAGRRWNWFHSRRPAVTAVSPVPAATNITVTRDVSKPR